MKKYLLIIVISITGGIMVGCKKHHTIPVVPPPSWQINDVSQYPASMTAVLEPPQNMEPYVTTSDELAAFIGNECRGIGQIITVNNEKMFFIMIHGTASENSIISFQYYRSWDKHLYKTIPFLNFAVDGNYGTVDLPQILTLVPTK